MRTNKIWLTVCWVFFILQLAAEALSLYAIIRLDMLPAKYTLVLVGIYALGLLVTGLMMFISPRWPSHASVRRTIACILAVLIIALCVMAYLAVSKLHSTVSQIVEEPDDTVVREVYVLTDDPAQSISDAAGYIFGIVENYDEAYTELAIAAIEDAVGGTVTTKAYATVYEMIDALYAGECGAIILNSGYLGFLELEEAYMDFEERTRILYEAPIDTALLPPEETQPDDGADVTEPEETEPAEPAELKSISQRPFIVYISGSDTRNYYLSKKGRNDVNILAVVNPLTHQVLLLNTPRDYYIPNPAGGGRLDKLTHCGVYGVDCSIKALANLYDTDVDYYARINFTGFEKLVDAMGGITVNSSYGFTAGGYTIVKGINHFDGAQALVFARERYQLPGGDNARGKNQMKVIQAMIAKLTSGTTILSNYAGILDSLSGMFATSVEMQEISELVKLQLDKMPTWNVQTFAVTGSTGRAITYSMPGSNLSVMFQNEAYVNHAKDLINRVLSGQTLTAADMELP